MERHTLTSSPASLGTMAYSPRTSFSSNESLTFRNGTALSSLLSSWEGLVSLPRGCRLGAASGRYRGRTAAAAECNGMVGASKEVKKCCFVPHPWRQGGEGPGGERKGVEKAMRKGMEDMWGRKGTRNVSGSGSGRESGNGH